MNREMNSFSCAFSSFFWGVAVFCLILYDVFGTCRECSVLLNRTRRIRSHCSTSSGTSSKAKGKGCTTVRRGVYFLKTQQ